MKFFETDQGKPHMGRITALIYTVALIPGCNYFQKMEARCYLRIAFSVGWWLSLGAKRPAYRMSDMLHPAGILGAVLVVVGLVGQYFVN